MAATTFSYRVRDRGGKVISGSLEAESPGAVASKLKGMGYAPITIEEAKGGGLSKELKIPGFSGKKKVKLKDLAVFSRQFATMINSGLSLLRALNILTEQTENPELARILGEVRNDVETGTALSAAMAKHEKVFPPLMVNMTKAGEVGGFLDSVMLQIAENYEAEVKLRGKVKAAMTYPVVVFILAILMCVVMLIFIVPTFAKMFKTLGGTLPAPTRVLIFLSSVLKIGAPFLLLALIGAFFVWRRVKHTERVRNVVDPMKLKMPVFGSLFQKIALSRFARNLGTMMKSGVPILQSLDIVADTTGNVVLARAIRDVQESVRTGEAISTPLENHPVFPPMVVQMMAVGEDTGALDTMLMKISQFYDQEVEATTESLTALIEPLMIAFLGGIVGSMIIALYMPIFKIFDLIK
jgi:type IV pilus assembly protein PilC